MCRSWQTIRPSRKQDQISLDTAKMIAGNNVSRDAWCQKDHPTPPRFASVTARS